MSGLKVTLKVTSWEIKLNRMTQMTLEVGLETTYKLYST